MHDKRFSNIYGCFQLEEQRARSLTELKSMKILLTYDATIVHTRSLRQTTVKLHKIEEKYCFNHVLTIRVSKIILNFLE